MSSAPVDIYDPIRQLHTPAFAAPIPDFVPYTTADSIAESRRAAYEAFNALTSITLGFVGGVWSVTEGWSPGIPIIIPPERLNARSGGMKMSDYLFRVCRVLGVPLDVYDQIIAKLKDRGARCDAVKAGATKHDRQEKARLAAAWREWREEGGERPVDDDDVGAGAPDPHAETFDDRRGPAPSPSRGAPRPAAASPFGVEQPPQQPDMRDVTDRLMRDWRAEIAAAELAAAEYETRPGKTSGSLNFAAGYGPDDVPAAVFWRLPATPPHMPSVFVPLFMSGWFAARLH